ncbi:MAG: polysaccharide deacetylase family protein [Anaerolineales bacterium]
MKSDYRPEKLDRRGFLKLAAAGGAAMAVPSGGYLFNWHRDVPPSLMLHSGNLKFFSELLPALHEHFAPMTYKGWMDRLDKLEGFSIWLARLFNLERASVLHLIGKRELPKLPLIISIDDVGTDWIRYEHMSMFDELTKRSIPAVVGIQPKLMPQAEARYWDRLIELHLAGWEIASHSINHPPLTQVDRTTAAFEILESCDRIEQAIGQRPTTLITPFGDSNPPTDMSEGNKRLYELAQEAGLRVVAGIQGGRSRLGSDQREVIRSIYPNGPIPEYAGRIPPDPRAEVTIEYLHNFNG